MSATIPQLPPYASVSRTDSPLVTTGRFGERRPWERLEVDGRMQSGGTSQICRRCGTGRWRKGKEKFGERKSGRPWPKNRPKHHRRREGKKEKIMTLMKIQKKKEEEEEAMNTNLAKNDAIFYTISHGAISIVTTFD